MFEHGDHMKHETLKQHKYQTTNNDVDTWRADFLRDLLSLCFFGVVTSFISSSWVDLYTLHHQHHSKLFTQD